MMEEMIIRPFDESDTNQIQRLFSQLTGKEIGIETVTSRLTKMLSSDLETLYVAQVKDELVGLVGFRIRENIEDITCYGEISVIVVDQKHRRKGIARKLIAYVNNLAKEKNCIGLWLVSGFGREEGAHEFYKEIGFAITGYRFARKY